MLPFLSAHLIAWILTSNPLDFPWFTLNDPGHHDLPSSLLRRWYLFLFPIVQECQTALVAVACEGRMMYMVRGGRLSVSLTLLLDIALHNYCFSVQHFKNPLGECHLLTTLLNTNHNPFWLRLYSEGTPAASSLRWCTKLWSQQSFIQAALQCLWEPIATAHLLLPKLDISWRDRKETRRPSARTAKRHRIPLHQTITVHCCCCCWSNSSLGKKQCIIRHHALREPIEDNLSSGYAFLILIDEFDHALPTLLPQILDERHPRQHRSTTDLSLLEN